MADSSLPYISVGGYYGFQPKPKILPVEQEDDMEVETNVQNGHSETCNVQNFSDINNVTISRRKRNYDEVFVYPQTKRMRLEGNIFFCFL